MKTKPHSLFEKVADVLDQAKTCSYKAVNSVMVQACWNIGKLIVEETRAGYGKVLLEELAKNLTIKYGKGFTETNLKYFRLFYIAFPICHSLSDKLTRLLSLFNSSISCFLPTIIEPHFRT